MTSNQAADALRINDGLPAGEKPIATLARAIVDASNNVVLDGTSMPPVTGAATVVTVGAFGVTWTFTATTALTFPTTGTLSTLAGAESLSTKTLVAPIISGAATMAANASLTPAAGTGAFDLSLATGIMKTPTSSTNLFTFLEKTAAGAATNLLAAATGTAIPVTANGSLAITQNGAETNTLAIPTFLGQVLDIFVDTDTSGARVITSAQRINQAGNTIITLTEVGDYIRLVAITIAGALRWQVASNDGAALS